MSTNSVNGEQSPSVGKQSPVLARTGPRNLDARQAVFTPLSSLADGFRAGSEDSCPAGSDRIQPL